MARPAPDYKIIKDNRSSDILLQHQNHVPQSPFFKPGDEHRYGKGVQIYGQPSMRGQDEWREARGAQSEGVKGGRGPGGPADDAGFPSNNSRIRHEQHMPQSPLYVPNKSPRHGYPQGPDLDQGQGQGRGYEANPVVFRDGPDVSPRSDYREDRGFDSLVAGRRSGADMHRDEELKAAASKRAEELERQMAEMKALQKHNSVSALFDTFRGEPMPPTIPDRSGTKDTFWIQEPARRVIPVRHTEHVPNSPFYRPGLPPPRVVVTPRKTPLPPIPASPQQPLQQRGPTPKAIVAEPEAVEEISQDTMLEVPKPQESPTPNYNVSALNFDEDPPNTKINLPSPRREYHISDYKGNPMPPVGDSLGYITQRTGYNPGFNTDRSYYDPRDEAVDPRGYSTGRPGSDSRYNPWAQNKPGRSDVADPRAGGGRGRNGGALLFIRFPVGQGENVSVAAQAFQRSKIHDVGGRFLGIAKKIYDFGYETGPAEALGVFHFPTMDKAMKFFQLDAIIRQPDFPPPYGHSAMWIICNAYMPDNLDLFNTFLLSEIELHPGKSKRQFFEEFQVDFEKFLARNGAMPFVVCSYGPQDRLSLRRHAYPAHDIVTCHLFQGLDHLKYLSGDETYCRFRSLHNQMATEKCSIFQLSKKVAF